MSSRSFVYVLRCLLQIAVLAGFALLLLEEIPSRWDGAKALGLIALGSFVVVNGVLLPRRPRRKASDEITDYTQPLDTLLSSDEPVREEPSEYDDRSRFECRSEYEDHSELEEPSGCKDPSEYEESPDYEDSSEEDVDPYEEEPLIHDGEVLVTDIEVHEAAAIGERLNAAGIRFAVEHARIESYSVGRYRRCIPRMRIVVHPDDVNLAMPIVREVMKIYP